MPVEQAAEQRPEQDDAFADARAALEELKGAAVETEPAEAETAQETADRLRDEKGRFAAKPEKDEAEVKTEAKIESKAEAKPDTKIEKPAEQEQVAQQPAQQPTQQVQTVAVPPPGWSVKSKAEWDKLPESIRADIAKREQEVTEGFKQYEGMAALRPYVEMAQRGGTTLKAALDNYVGIENLLKQDFDSGIAQLAQNFGQSPQQLVQRLAQRFGLSYQSPQAAGLPQSPQMAEPGSFDPTLLQQYINPLSQELNSIKHQLTQQQQAEQTRQQDAINSAVDRFKSDPAHRYFENVKPLIAQLFSGGIVPETGDYVADPKKAYELACNMDPDIREQSIKDQFAKAEADRKQREKDAAEQARKASRSITGSPSGAVQEKDDNRRGSPHDDARRAYDEVTARV